MCLRDLYVFSNAVVTSFEDKLMGNPVGWLQELCMSRFWPPPSYHAENDDNVNRRKHKIQNTYFIVSFLTSRSLLIGLGCP